MQVETPKFFSARRPDLLALKRDDREKTIEQLADTDPTLHRLWLDERRKQLGTTSILKRSGMLQLSTEGNVNSYGAFLELGALLTASRGYCAMIVQSGIATDDQMKGLFAWIVESQRLASLFDFENRHLFFRDVHPQFKFALVTLGGSHIRHEAPAFVFFATDVADTQSSKKRFTLTIMELRTLNPNTLTCPTFQTAEAAELSKWVYAQMPVLSRDSGVDSGWHPHIQRMYDMAYDADQLQTYPTIESHGFINAELASYDTEGGSGVVRLFEAKYFHQFDHRFATTVGQSGHNQVPEGVEAFSQEQKANPEAVSVPRYWVARAECSRRFYTHEWRREWIVVGRQIARASDERTSIFTIVPFVGVSHSCYTFRFPNRTPTEVACFVANVNSFVFDWCARQKVGGANFSVFIVRQLPVVAPLSYPTSGPTGLSWIAQRVLELCYTAWDLRPFAADYGWLGPPFRWDEERRFLLRCEIDAAFFHFYLPAEASGNWRPVEGKTTEDLARLKHSFPSPRDAVAHIMETFPIVKRKDIEKHGNYRTKLVILDIYDRMQRAIATGEAYETLLDPPPADPRVAHAPRPLAAPAVGFSE